MVSQLDLSGVILAKILHTWCQHQVNFSGTENKVIFNRFNIRNLDFWVLSETWEVIALVNQNFAYHTHNVG